MCGVSDEKSLGVIQTHSFGFRRLILISLQNFCCRVGNVAANRNSKNQSIDMDLYDSMPPNFVVAPGACFHIVIESLRYMWIVRVKGTIEFFELQFPSSNTKKPRHKSGFLGSHNTGIWVFNVGMFLPPQQTGIWVFNVGMFLPPQGYIIKIALKVPKNNITRSGAFVTPVTRCAGSRWGGLQICSGVGTNRTAWAVAIEHQEHQEWGVCYPCDQVRQLQLGRPADLLRSGNKSHGLGRGHRAPGTPGVGSLLPL